MTTLSEQMVGNCISLISGCQEQSRPPADENIAAHQVKVAARWIKHLRRKGGTGVLANWKSD